MKLGRYFLTFFLLKCSINAKASTFYVDPINGNMKNPGTTKQPWKTLEEVINSQFIDNKNLNHKSYIKSGDTVILMSGYHGDIRIKSGYNDKVITIKAENNHQAVIGSLKLNTGKNWNFSNLIIKGSASKDIQNNDYMVEIGSKDKASNIILANCYIYSSENWESWEAKDWESLVFHGISLGLNASEINLTNNYIANVKLGINSNAINTIIDGNIISYFSKDGIRVSANHNTIKYNIITNNVLDDNNHDDAIQGYSPEGLSDIELTGNIILERTDEYNLFVKPLQGIAFFDGPNSNIKVTHNVIKITGYHGISMYDAKDSLIADNYVIGTLKNKARISFGTKGKGFVEKNTVIDNTSQAFILDLDKNLTEKNNTVIKFSDYTFFNKYLKIRLEEINNLYGEQHHLSKKYRLALPPS